MKAMIDFIKDADCTKETPVKLGVPDAPIYGKGIKLKPRVDGRTDSEHFKKIYLPELLPLEEYDLIVVLISGGKDSVACYLKLLELGVPKERIEFWHHDIDGGHPSKRMDWKCTQNYVKALADAEGIKLRVSYRVNGFFGELYRIGASEPIEWIDPDTGEVKQCKLSSNAEQWDYKKGRYQLVKGGRNTEGYADPTATIAVGRVAKEEREQIECEAADKRAYDLIKVLKYIIKGAGFELTERVQVKDTKTGRVYR